MPLVGLSAWAVPFCSELKDSTVRSPSVAGGLLSAREQGGIQSSMQLPVPVPGQPGPSQPQLVPKAIASNADASVCSKETRSNPPQIFPLPAQCLRALYGWRCAHVAEALQAWGKKMERKTS